MIAHLIEVTVDQHGIATFSWNMPGHHQNVLNAASCEALIWAIDGALANQGVRGILMTSAKPEFVMSGDHEWLLSADDPGALFKRVMRLHRALRNLETAGKPVAFALPGSALGGGLEIALAGHYRVAADNPMARFGLPEVTLGLLPDAGGTQRLPRLIGIQKALPVLLEGLQLNAADALKLGVLDAVVAPGTELQTAHAWLLAQQGIPQQRVQQPWDAKGYSIPGGAVGSPAVQQLLMAANALLRAKTFGNYPAPVNILSCIYEGLLTDLDTGLQIEARYFLETAMSPIAKNMLRTLFFSMDEAKKLAARPAGVPVQRYSRVGILGAGMMGAGIAYVAAKAGLQVVLIDAEQGRAEKGKAYAEALVGRQVARAQMPQAAAESLLERIVPTTDYGMLDGAEMVIEAVFEDRALKSEVTRNSEAVIGVDAIFASNTSTLPITGLAAASARPANFIGLHFFSPVDKMKLVEVILGEQTSQQTLARALDLIKLLGMTPIVVNDSRGFYTSRVFSTYLLEGMAMLAEGIAPALIENAGLMAGMPVGPLALTDEVSSELVYRVDKQTRADLGPRYRPRPGNDVAATMVEIGRVGKKAAEGFFDYPPGGNKHLWHGLADLFPVAGEQPAVQQLIERLVAVQAIEAVRCMEEGVLTSARDADVGAILGWGFPSFRGGPLSMIHTQGIDSFIAQCERLERAHGARYAVPRLLNTMRDNGQTFY